MSRKLQASLELVAEATDEVVRKRNALISAAFLPVAGILLIDAVTADSNLPKLLRFFLRALTFPLWVLYATTVHRVVLLGANALPSRFGLFWTERETRFLGWLIGIWFLYFALSIPTGIAEAIVSDVFLGWDVTWLTVILSHLIVAYFEGRFGLVLPATAIDRRSSFREAWAMSRGKGWMIAVALVIPTLALIPLEYALYYSIDERFSVIADLIWLIVALPIFAIGVAIISLAYAKLAPRDGV